MSQFSSRLRLAAATCSNRYALLSWCHLWLLTVFWFGSVFLKKEQIDMAFHRIFVVSPFNSWQIETCMLFGVDFGLHLGGASGLTLCVSDQAVCNSNDGSQHVFIEK